MKVERSFVSNDRAVKTHLEDLAAMEKGLQALFRKLPVLTSSLVVCAIWNIILRFLNVKNKSLR